MIKNTQDDKADVSEKKIETKVVSPSYHGTGSSSAQTTDFDE